MKTKIHEMKNLPNASHVFKDRAHAGGLLAEMLQSHCKDVENMIVLAIPAGGVPVGLEISRRLRIAFDLVIVRKLQVPGNTEAGFGAMTLDGSTFINEELVSHFRITPSQVEEQRALVKRDLEERNKLFRKGRPEPGLSGKTAVLVDDGVASGYTMIASIHAVKNSGAAGTVVAVPTAPLQSVEKIAPLVHAVYCTNVRVTPYFAVADAYMKWYDLSREEVLELMDRYESSLSKERINMD